MFHEPEQCSAQRAFSWLVHGNGMMPVVIMYQVAATGYASLDSYQLLLPSSWSEHAEPQIVAAWTGDFRHDTLLRFLCDQMRTCLVMSGHVFLNIEEVSFV